jgi:hypothetical protein
MPVLYLDMNIYICALSSGCDYLVTCDARLVRQGQRLREQGVMTLKVINPVDLLQEV